jgi:hypothetical protein
MGIKAIKDLQSPAKSAVSQAVPNFTFGMKAAASHPSNTSVSRKEDRRQKKRALYRNQQQRCGNSIRAAVRMVCTDFTLSPPSFSYARLPDVNGSLSNFALKVAYFKNTKKADCFNKARRK